MVLLNTDVAPEKDFLSPLIKHFKDSEVFAVGCMDKSIEKGKVVLNWLVILLRYNVRPRYYLFNKNDAAFRTLDLPVFEKHPGKIFKKSPAKQENKAPVPAFALKDLARLQNVMRDPKYSFVLKAGKKGGFYVSLGQVQK